MALDPLATLADYEARNGTVDAGDLTRVTAALVDASTAVRQFCGQNLSQATYTRTLLVRDGVIRLPQRPVTDVDTITAVAGTLSPRWEWDGLDVIRRCGLYLRTASVVFTAGYTANDMPDEIITVVCAAAARGAASTPAEAIISSTTLGPFSETRGTIGAAGAVGLFPDEKALLGGYRRVGGSIRVG